MAYRLAVQDPRGLVGGGQRPPARIIRPSSSSTGASHSTRAMSIANSRQSCRSCCFQSRKNGIEWLIENAALAAGTGHRKNARHGDVCFGGRSRSPQTHACSINVVVGLNHFKEICVGSSGNPGSCFEKDQDIRVQLPVEFRRICGHRAMRTPWQISLRIPTAVITPGDRATASRYGDHHQHLSWIDAHLDDRRSSTSSSRNRLPPGCQRHARQHHCRLPKAFWQPDKCSMPLAGRSPRKDDAWYAKRCQLVPGHRRQIDINCSASGERTDCIAPG